MAIERTGRRALMLRRAAGTIASLAAAAVLSGCWTHVELADRCLQAGLPSAHGNGAGGAALPPEFVGIDGLRAGELVGLVYQGASCDCGHGDIEDVDGGYCATLAAIKASIATFGVAGVLSSLDYQGGTFTAVQRDGTTLALAPEEWRLAWNADAGMVPGICPDAACHAGAVSEARAKALRSWIVLYLALAAKKLQTSGPTVPSTCTTGVEGFRRALKAVSNGFLTPEVLVLVGVQDYAYEPKDLDGAIAVAWTSGHTMFSYKGIVDRWGKPRRPTFLRPLESRGLQQNKSPAGEKIRLTGGWDPVEMGEEDRTPCP